MEVVGEGEGQWSRQGGSEQLEEGRAGGRAGGRGEGARGHHQPSS